MPYDLVRVMYAVLLRWTFFFEDCCLRLHENTFRGYVFFMAPHELSLVAIAWARQ